MTITITNEESGQEITVNSDKNFRELNRILDSVTARQMTEKAEKEENPQRKKMMLLYAKRRKELELQGLLPNDEQVKTGNW